jgi:hypothetical protein
VVAVARAADVVDSSALKAAVVVACVKAASVTSPVAGKVSDF